MAGTRGDTLVDVLDNQGSIVGELPRDQALAAGLPVRTVHVFLLNEAGSLLLQLLGAGRDRHRLIWGSSAAAWPRPGESIEATARRRLEEELGVRPKLDEVGTLITTDGNSRKFVTLFQGDASEAVVREPDLIARIELWPLSEIDAQLTRDPSQFTETFGALYRWWRAQKSSPRGV